LSSRASDCGQWCCVCLFDLLWPRGKKEKKKQKKNFLHFHFPLDSIPEIKIFPFYLNLNF